MSCRSTIDYGKFSKRKELDVNELPRSGYGELTESAAEDVIRYLNNRS